MATVVGGQVKLNDGSLVNPQNGGWYDGQQYWNGSLGSAGVINNPEQQGYGQAVSNEVVRQTNPANVSFLENIRANSIQGNVSFGLPSGNSNTAGLQATADNARRILDETLAKQKEEADKKLAEARAKEQDILNNEVKPLTEPFRADLEAAQRESLYVNQNFEANQALVDELDQLLTEGNDIIRQQQNTTGLAAIRNPRINKTISDIQARAGVIEAVMNARNSQIAQAYTMIDRTVAAIQADRNDQLNYWQTVLELNNRDILSLDAESKAIASKQVELLQGDYERAAATVDYVKQLMINPDTALLMGQAGVTLNDSVETINQKLSYAQYAREVSALSNEMAANGYSIVTDPSSVPADQLTTVTDSQGKQYYYRKIESKSSGSGGSGGGLTSTQQRAVRSVASKAISEVDTNHDNRLSLDEYKRAVALIMAETGLDFATADEYASQMFQELGYVQWGKGW